MQVEKTRLSPESCVEKDIFSPPLLLCGGRRSDLRDRGDLAVFLLLFLGSGILNGGFMTS